MSWVLHGYVLNFRPLRPIFPVNFDGVIHLVVLALVMGKQQGILFPFSSPPYSSIMSVN